MSTQLSNFKHPIWRCKKYLKWVKRQPSVISGQMADDAHHVKRCGFPLGIKPPDWAVFPLTRDEHTAFHRMGAYTWQSVYGEQWEFIGKTLGKAIDEGVLELGVIRD